MTKQHFRSGAGNQVAAAAMVFENPEFGKIRTLTDSQGEPLFCGKDVCEALGLGGAHLRVCLLAQGTEAGGELFPGCAG